MLVLFKSSHDLHLHSAPNAHPSLSFHLCFTPHTPAVLKQDGPYFHLCSSASHRLFYTLEIRLEYFFLRGIFAFGLTFISLIRMLAPRPPALLTVEKVGIIFTVTELCLRDLTVSAECFVFSLSLLLQCSGRETQCVALRPHYFNTGAGCFCRRLHFVVAGFMEAFIGLRGKGCR